MNKFQSSLSLSTFAIVGALALSAFTSSANASVTSNLLNCKFNTKQKTISCCQQAIQGRKLPRWFLTAGGSCSAAVKCVGRGGQSGRSFLAASRKCYVYYPNGNEGGRDGGDIPPTQRQFRTFN